MMVHGYTLYIRIEQNLYSHDVIVAESDYDIKVPAIVQKDNYFGTQFHPEKSGDVGALMLKNFLRV